ncbi:MAG: hypothetical protein JXD22_01560 [Sedimentisphaerales bacterium]|nr:hypothetical protein [Sedimentisphaerales bacterium]
MSAKAFRLFLVLFISFGIVQSATAVLEIEATAEHFIREIDPNTICDNDGISVWSTAKGDRRYGLIEFDVSSLAGNTIAGATLQLYSAVHQWSDYHSAIKQTSYVIDCSSGSPLSSLDWITYMAQKDAGKEILETLGSYDLPAADGDPAQQNAYVESNASEADLVLIQTAVDGDGKFCVVLIADESGAYGQSWGDGKGNWSGLVAKLVIQPNPAIYDFESVSDVFVRQTFPDLTYEDDGISIWSSVSPDGGKRYGLVEFDLSSLTGEEVAVATLQLYSAVHSWSDYFTPIKQSAYIIDCSSGTGLSSLTWNSYMSEKDTGKVTLETLGSYDLPAADTDPSQQNAYVDSVANAADLSLIQSVIDGDGKLCVVFIAEEDGTNYGQSWGDVVLMGLAPNLQIQVLSELSYSPTPSDGCVSVARNASMTWQPGIDAISHNIYLGTSYEQVLNAGDPFTLPGRGNQLLGNEAYTPPVPFDYDTTYFWRIDEVSNAGTTKGMIWRFSTISGKAALPYPADGAYVVKRDPVLSWTAGVDAETHHIYLGTDYAEVEAAVDPNVYPGRGSKLLGDESYSVETLLDPNRFYYWRIDEVNPTDTAMGNIWRFQATGSDPSTCDGLWAMDFGKVSDYNQDCIIDLFDLSYLTGLWLNPLNLNDYSMLADDWNRCNNPTDPNCEKPWRKLVVNCLDTLIAHGTDVYGAVHTPLLMAVIDVNTLISPENPLLLDSVARLEPGRLHRRAERGSNLWYDQATVRAMYLVSQLVGDTKYADAADAYMAYTLQYCHKADDFANVYRNGMLSWGTHIYWDCYEDCPGGDGGGNGPHEILVYHPEWADLYRLNAAAVTTLVDGIWQYHVWDKVNGCHNRHDDGGAGCDFAFSGGSFAMAFAYMYSVTGQQHYLDKALLVTDWHWQHRDPVTGLVPDAPALTDRYDGTHCMTSTIGPHVSQLLRCYELTGVDHFRDVAISYVKAYDNYAWDDSARNYWAMLELDGTPVPEQQASGFYDQWAPYGYVDVWRTTIYSYEFPLVAAQAAIFAYEQSDYGSGRDPQLLTIAEHWAELIENNLPPYVGRRWKEDLEAEMPDVLLTEGTYAENYGRTISFFVHLYRATGNDHYLSVAQDVATEAVQKLYKNGLFKGHPAKPYYEATNGVGFFLYSLLELDQPDSQSKGAF